MMRNGIRRAAAAAVLSCLAGLAWAGYGDDRALIEDLQSRYLFAFDFGDPEGYAGTFTPDGILDFGQGEVKGRAAIAKFIEDGRKRQLEARAMAKPEATMKTLSCSSCGAAFGCGAQDADHDCWCASFPPVAPSAERGTCLCPACLAVAATTTAKVLP